MKPVLKMIHPIHHVPENPRDPFAINARKDEEEEEACSAGEASVLSPSPFQPPRQLVQSEVRNNTHSRPFKSIHSAIVTKCLGSARYCSNLGTQQAKEKTLLHSWEHMEKYGEGIISTS